MNSGARAGVVTLFSLTLCLCVWACLCLCVCVQVEMDLCHAQYRKQRKTQDHAFSYRTKEQLCSADQQDTPASPFSQVCAQSCTCYSLKRVQSKHALRSVYTNSRKVTRFVKKSLKNCKIGNTTCKQNCPSFCTAAIVAQT